MEEKERVLKEDRLVAGALRMLDRTFLTVAAARAAVASSAGPLDRNPRLAALTHDLTAALFDLACVAAATLLADLPDLDVGPWAKAGPAWDLGADEGDLEL